jgi:PAS domain S-box-containing protein
MRIRRRTGSDRLLHLGIAVLSVAVALGLTFLVLPWLYPTVTPFFFVAVIVSTGLGGWDAGLLATVLSTLAVHSCFIDPGDFWQLLNVGTGVRLGLFAIAAGLTSWLDRSRRLAVERARADYQALKETVEREEAARTQRRQAEESLRQSEDRFRTVVANLPKGAVFIIDRDLRYLLAAGEALQAVGISPEGLVGKTIWEALDSNLATSYEPYFRQALQGEPFSMEHNSHDRDYISHGTPLYNERGEIYAVLAMSYDISEHKRVEDERKRAEDERNQAEAALRQNQEIFSSLVANAPFGVYVIDSAFRIRQANQIAIAAFQVSSLIGRDLAEALRIIWQEPFATEAINHFLHTLATGESYYSSPMVEPRADIEEIQSYDWQIHRITFLDSGFGVVCYFYDLSEIKRAEIIVRQNADRNAFRVTLTDALRPIADPLEIQAMTSQMLGEYLGANRVAYFEVRGDHYVVERDYVNGATPMAGSYPIDLFGSKLFAAYRTGRPVFAAHVETDPNLSADQKSAYAARQITAYIGVPLVKDGEFVAGLGVHSSKPREWTADEVALVEEAADRIWTAVDRARAEAALRESEARLQRAIAIETVGVIFFSTDGRITEASEAFLRMSGYSREDVTHGLLRWDELTPPEWMPISLEAIKEFETTGRTTPYEKEYVRKDGSRWWGLFAATRLSETEGVEFITDISDRKQTEALLRQSESRFRLIVESAKEYAIFTLDLNNVVTGWNAGAEHLLGYVEADIIGRSGRIIFTPEDQEQGRHEREIQIALTQGQAVNERWHVRQDGSRFWGSGLMMTLQDEAGNTQGFVKILQDKTAQRQTEAQREQLLQQEQAAREAAEQANRIKDEFLAVLSHELRSPLNPILGWSRLLQSGNLDTDKTAQALATIERNAKLQSELIEDLLDVSRILRGKLNLNVSPIHLAVIIRGAIETVRLAAEAKSITVEAKLDCEIGQVAGDSTRLQQVVWNLLSNAVKFTPPGGRVEVRLEQVDHQAQITVSDNGKGILADFLPSVFDYFRQENSTTTRQFGGLGLGLAIVHHLVELHGGTVTAASAGEGLGATFTVKLPLLKRGGDGETERQGEHYPPTHSLTHPLTGLHILVIDDEADSRDFVAFVLEQAGASVSTVATASEGFFALTQSLPDVLVSDIGMPDMDGYMLMQQIRALPSEQGGWVKAIALTAYAGDFNQQQALQAGFQQHVSKPVEPEELVRTIQALLTG